MESNPIQVQAPIANPDIVLRTEFDGWGILFDPDTGEATGISPTGVFIYERLNGLNDKQKILAELQEACGGNLPDEAGQDYNDFIASLQEKGYLAQS